MSPTKISTCLVSTLLSALACLCQPVFSAAANHSVSPQELYHQAWLLVRDKYYDTSFAGKDWSLWEHKFDAGLATTQQAQQAIADMLAQLGDPYTRFLSAKEFGKEKELMTDSQMVGLGILLEQGPDKAHLFVSETVEDSPARQAGIAAGEELLEIDGQPVSKLLPDQCGEKIASKGKSNISLLLKGAGGQRTICLKPGHLVLHPVSLKELEGNIGYIKLSSFLYGDAAAEFRQGLLRLANKDGLIIDLRHNPGGQTFSALEIADMLLDHGVILNTVDRKGTTSDTALGCQITKQPLVVLVDHDSASASEILAAALKDHQRADIVGTRTFGKGLVQEIEPLPGGAALHLTVARFMSPNGSQINHVGITPNVEVAASDDQLKAGLELLKAKIASANQASGQKVGDIL